MEGLSFFVEATARGSGAEREGSLAVDGHEIRYSVPASMGGKGVGASPETLLISAVTACYTLTLLAYLSKRRLPYREIAVRTQGVVTGSPRHVYSRIIVNPTVLGADPDRGEAYRDSAADARSHCFIGQTVAAGGVQYELGSVEFV